MYGTDHWGFPSSQEEMAPPIGAEPTSAWDNPCGIDGQVSYLWFTYVKRYAQSSHDA